MKKEKHNIIAENNNNTVVSEYIVEDKKAKSYQSESELESDFIEQLKSQGYEYLDINCEDDLKKNIRKQLEILNKFEFTDNEWDLFFESEIANQNHGIKDKTKIIQEDYIKVLRKEDGDIKNIYFLNKENVHENCLQVINQYQTDKGKRTNRYDVTVLVNGFPVVHVELKRRGVAIKEAFNQINRYQRESFWADSGLFEYIQLFIISNGTHTKYYSNTTRYKSIKAIKSKKANQKRKSNHSFEFTNWWADANNKAITDLIDFTKTFFC